LISFSIFTYQGIISVLYRQSNICAGLLLIFLCNPVWGNSPQEGPYYRFDWSRTINYSRSDYHAGIQNWSIAQSADGIMYFANTSGLLSFDGSEWELQQHPDNHIIRSVATDPSAPDRIYAGTYEDFGYWEKDPYGSLHYQSLKYLVEDFDFNNQEIWKILVQGDSVWFQSFTVVFLYHNDQIRTILSPGVITCFTEIHGQTLARITGQGLFRLDSSGFNLIDSSDIFRNHMIRVMLPYGNRRMLVATSDDGIFSYSDDGTLSAWNPVYQSTMMNRVINRGLHTQDGHYVFGTQLYGLAVFDSTGVPAQEISKANGLQNNTVLALYEGDQGYLWAGLDNGIDLIDRTSGISFYRDTEGKIGAVYSVLVHENTLYVGTNKGLFYAPLEQSNFPGIYKPDFRLIPGSESQVWSLEVFGNQIFCGHNSGTFELTGRELRKISNVSGAYAMKPMQVGSETFLVQSTYTNLVIYRYQNGRWKFSHEVFNFNQPAKYIEVDHLGHIWLGHITKGLYRVELDDSLRHLKEVKKYDRSSGFAGNSQVGVFKVNNRIVFINEGHFYTYDDLNDSIVPYNLLKGFADSVENYQKIVPDSGNIYWFISDRQLMRCAVEDTGVICYATYHFDLFENRQIRNYENIRRVNSVQSILCLDNGFVVLPNYLNYPDRKSETPILKSVRVSSGKDRSFLRIHPAGTSQSPVLQYKSNSIELHFASPSYGKGISYEYLLEGLDENWITSGVPICRYDRLPAGTYRFRLRAIHGAGVRTRELNWTFEVHEPWYWSIVARLVYVLSLLLLVALIVRYFRRRLAAQEKSLKAKQDAEIIRIRNEQLRSEISYKSKELSNTTYSIMKKNELLLEIKTALEKEIRSAGPDQKRSFRRISRLVDRNISHDEDWKVFESNFERAHEEFLFRIKDQYPELTPGDLKLCAYLRMNLSTKKIALLLGISNRGVENHRYRLRKKLDLDREANLVEFMMKF